MQSDFMYRAATSGEVDVVAGYSSDGRIAQYDLIVLDDPEAGAAALRRHAAVVAAARA